MPADKAFIRIAQDALAAVTPHRLLMNCSLITQRIAAAQNTRQNIRHHMIPVTRQDIMLHTHHQKIPCRHSGGIGFYRRAYLRRMQEVFVCIKENDIISRHMSQCKIPRRREIIPPWKFIERRMIFRRRSGNVHISRRRDDDDLIRRR